MSPKISAIVESIASLTLIEGSELSKEIQKFFVIEVSQMSLQAPTAPSALSQKEEIVEEKTDFQVVLVEVPADKKIAALKIVRSLTGLGLKESKDVVDNVPKVIKEKATKDESESIKKDFEAVGAKVEIK